MKVEQVYSILNNIVNESLGQTIILNEDLSNVVDVGKAIEGALDVDKYVRKLVNHIGRVIFVNRLYKPKAPDIMMDGWEYGSIVEKIDSDMPESVKNDTWDLQNGTTYNQDTFVAPKNVRAKFFNQMVTYEVDISYTDKQVKQSFSNATQLNAFFSMIETKIKNRFSLDYRNLTMRTINNFIGATIYKDFNAQLSQETHEFDFGTRSGVRAINLLGLYKETVNPASELDAETCMYDLDFLKFASRQIALTSDRMEDISTLFNIGGRQRFTPKDRQKLVLLSEFAKSADVYLQSDTFHEEYTKLPQAETVIYWQGTGTDYDFDSTSGIHITSSNFTADGTTFQPSVEIKVSGIIGCIFDRDALGVWNVENRVPAHYNAKGEFTNFFYKSEARYFNDYDENFVVFFVA